MKSPRVTSAVVTLGMVPARAFIATAARGDHDDRGGRRRGRACVRTDLHFVPGGVARHRDPFLEAAGDDDFVRVHRRRA